MPAKVAPEKPTATRLDGRASWIIAAVCFLLTLISGGFSRSSSLFFTAIMSTFGASRTDAALPLSVLAGFYNLSGLVSGPLIHVYGVRRVAVGGGFLMAAGLMMSYFAEGTVYLIFSLGVVNGTGYGLIFACALVAINQNFDRHRGLAQGVNLTGATVASFVFPKMFEYLLQQVGLKMTLVAFGAVLLHLPLLSLLLRPPPTPEETKMTIVCIEGIMKEKPGAQFPVLEKCCVEIATKPQRQTSAIASAKDILSRRRFYFHAVGYAAFSFFLDTFLTIAVDYAVDSGLQMSDAVLVLTLFSITDTAGRLLVPLIGDHHLVSHTGLMTISYFLIALLAQTFPFTSDRWSFSGVCLAFGLPMGYAIVGISQVITEEVGIDNLPMAYGFVSAITAAGSFARPFVIGFFRDSYGSYEGLFRLLGGMMTVSFLFCLVLWLTERRKQSKYSVKDTSCKMQLSP